MWLGDFCMNTVLVQRFSFFDDLIVIPNKPLGDERNLIVLHRMTH